ncbi:MAG: amidophosphoribosyltransferase [Methanosarcina sp.]
MKEECGVAGIILPGDRPQSNTVAFQLYYALYALQHRGQESTGIMVYDGRSPKSIKGMGLVPDVYNKDSLARLIGNVGVGHVRYSTTGGSKIENCQPFILNFKGGTVAIAHNGNLVNAKTLKDELEWEGRIFISDSDTEVIGHLLVKELIKHGPVESIRNVMRRLVGSYSLVIHIDGILYAVRDPLGFKPLCFGEVDGGYAVVSESVALDTLNGTLLRDVRPGEIMVFRNDSFESHQVGGEAHPAHCVFEYIYFARPDSVIDGKLVYKVRENIGRELAKEHPVDADIVSPVPDSGITSAIGYARESHTKYLEGLMKNRYIGRTFILPGQELRETAVRLKMNTIQDNVKGKRVVLVDDSIVRGTTSRRIIDMVRKAGASEIHARVGSPAIIAPCYLGIDMATRQELIASYKTIKEVEVLINADSLGYLSIEGLMRALECNRNDMCIGCLTGEYPVEIPGEKCRKKQTHLNDFDSTKSPSTVSSGSV